MRSTSMFSSRSSVARALTISVATGLAALSVDACQNDSPLAPASTLQSQQASADRGGALIRPGSGILTWTLKDGTLLVPLAGGTDVDVDVSVAPPPQAARTPTQIREVVRSMIASERVRVPDTRQRRHTRRPSSVRDDASSER